MGQRTAEKIMNEKSVQLADALMKKMIPLILQRKTLKINVNVKMN